MPSSERSATWQQDPPLLYFIKDYRDLWRLPIDDAGGASGPPRPWFVPLRGLRVLGDSLDVNPYGRRLLVGLERPESDIWLVELEAGQ
ncbi:MAG TPA: hypothetical protein VMS86_07845 [Thermoanaerobaculia bacterium]|nr:hypothetical protein [Thermoanaerobaculia bacterium]